MELPSNFQNTIANTFYDKLIKYYDTVINDNGAGMKQKAITGDAIEFYGNARFDNLAEVQELHGLRDKIDISITCKTSVAITIGKIMEYYSKYYLVTEVMPSDSHLLIVGKQWSSKS